MLESGREAYIVGAVRTPIARAHPEKGDFRDVPPNALLAACFSELLDTTGVAPVEIEDVIAGCVNQFGEQSRNIARNAWLQAGFPPEVPATTIDRRCGSAQSALAYGAALIASGTHDLAIAAGDAMRGGFGSDLLGESLDVELLCAQQSACDLCVVNVFSGGDVSWRVLGSRAGGGNRTCNWRRGPGAGGESDRSGLRQPVAPSGLGTGTGNLR